MTGQRPTEVFAHDRPLRSDSAQSALARERSYARRRVMTVIILISIIASVMYGVWGRGPTRPGEIPTIKSEGIYKQKPTDPGGIDIPHQDVRVYDELENKTVPSDQVEHLLPPPEVPQEMPPHAAGPVIGFSKQIVVPPQSLPSTPNVSLAPSHMGGDEPLALGPAPGKPVTTTVMPTSTLPLSDHSENAQPEPIPASTPIQPHVTGPAPLTSHTPSLSIEQVIADTKALASTPHSSSPSSIQTAPTAVATDKPLVNTAPIESAKVPQNVHSDGKRVIQLASVSDEAGAESMMTILQQKYAKDLSGVSLHLARADLGSRGIFYRIQSQGLDEDRANHICFALKQQNAGCILVRK